jgi:DNA polymerase-3 subunit chi
MTQIGFYHLLNTPLEAALPRLLSKAVEQGMRALVMAASPARVKALDGALWVYDQGSFLPHGTAKEGRAEAQPIYLTATEENPNGASLLVLTDGLAPSFIDGFERCLDLFDGKDQQAVAAARARWKRLADAGHDLYLLAANRPGRLAEQTIIFIHAIFFCSNRG